MNPLYPSLAPLPTPKRPKTKTWVPKGQVRVEDYERRQFEGAWKTKDGARPTRPR